MSKYFRTNSNKTKSRSSDDPFGTNIQVCHSKNDQTALENYATWLRERHAIHNKIAKKTHRQSGELLMNIGDEYNVVIEEKRALEYTRIPQKFDKYRGNPEWWEFPPGLHEKCRFRRDKIIYFYQKTTVQKNIIPTIEKVGLPGFIKNEKMLFPRTRNVYDKWQNLNYRKNRVEELSSLLVNIEPHKPYFDPLIVLGKTIQCQEDDSQTICSLNKNIAGTKEGRKKTSVYDCSLKYCLKINGVFFYENSQSLSTSRKFHVLFEYDIQSLPFQTQYIVFENVGRVTIRLTWQKMEKFRLFRDISSTNNTEHFCFDKNMLILVPGQIVNFPIWFQTNKVCTVLETWEIKTLPKFWSEPIRVFFVLQAQTHIENFMNRITIIKKDINQRVKRRIIKEILEDIMKKTNYQNYNSIDYSYYEPELFEAMNLDDSHPIRKPKYMYDKELVQQLKKFYSEVRQSYHPKTWNLNVWDLQVLARVKDLIEYAELRTLEFSQFRASLASRSDMMDDKRRKSFSEIKLKQKASGSELDNQSDQFSLRETKHGQLMKLLWKMAPRSISLNEERMKFFQVYSIFNAYFTLMAQELYEIKAFHGIPVKYKQELYENCPRLTFENFDDIQLNRTKRSFLEDTTAQPKPEILRDISSTDVATVHNLYFMSSPSEFVFGKTSTKQEKNEKKKSKQEDNRMSRAKQSKISSSRTNMEDACLVILDFDPYEEVPSFLKENVSTKRTSTTCEETSSKQGDEEENKTKTLNIYVVIYTYLSYAVDAMVDTLESAKEYREPHRNIEQLKDCFKLFIDEEATEMEDVPVNPFQVPEERDYFEKILEAHLNEVTGQYLICGKTEPVTILRQPALLWSEEKELIHVPSVFTLYKPEPEEVRYAEREAQTLPTTDVCENEIVSFNVKDICECPSEYRHSPHRSPSDIFYYSDDEVFEDLDMVEGRKTQGGSLDEAVVTEVPKKKPSLGRASLSLMKEWNRKKCSRDEFNSLEESPI